MDAATFLAPLLAKALDRAPARDANAAIERARAEVGEGSRSFEVVAGDGAEWLERTLLPKLVYHLESLGIRPPKYPRIFASLFVGDEVVFVRMQDLMEFSSGVLGLTADRMYEKWGTGERREAVRDEKKPILALPGKGE